MELRSKFIAAILCWLCALEGAISARPLSILIASFPAAGHITPSANLGEELVRRGHSVTLCTLETEGSDLARKRAELGGMTYSSAGNASFSVAQMQDIFVATDLENKSLSNIKKAITEGMKVWGWLPEVANKIGKHLNHQNLTEYDMVISTEYLAPMTACLSRKWNVPAMILSTTLQYQSGHMPPWAFPLHYMYKRGTLFTSDNLNFFRRFLATLFRPIIKLSIDHLLVGSIINGLEFECPGAPYSVLRYFPGTNAPQIVPTTIGFEYPRIISSLTHYVGPILSNLPQEVPVELQDWLDKKPRSSVILISMGSLARLTRARGRIIVESVLSTNYSVVWSLRDKNRFILEGLELNKERFYISKWIPQAAILKHLATGIAFLHGGMNGIHEALSYGVPIIVMPFSADQGDLAARVHHSGVGVQILKEYLTKETLTAAIQHIQEGKTCL
jgi:UDP:flavonoid glycosyltransferase YjiC (YdhE family)